ncbi:MAG TPA: hypothetical protein VKV04_12675 [Verrucomicrobiae bacterium]|nr:hypothetical protein [Verrucomicrobiae bacterium]
MRSPIAALTWEIWRRGRRAAAAVVGCIAFCAIINLIVHNTNGRPPSSIFGFLMVLSFAFLLGLFNCTEFNSTREWNGFPYRLFVLPVPTWQLVAVPMVLGLIAIEGVYFAWVKLVWTHGQLDNPDAAKATLWWAVVLGAYLTYYQVTVWSLAGFRILRSIVLSVGGVSSILVACLPFFGRVLNWPWITVEHLIPIVLTTIPMTFIIAWVTVARQRHGGGRRRNFVKALMEWITDRLPRRTKKFSSPAAAQFWFEWRRAGLLLPAAVGFALFVVVAPISWATRDDPHFPGATFTWIIVLPIVLGIILGKGFAKAEFYSRNLSVPTFLGVRPISDAEIVAAKIKVAAVSVLITWVMVGAFLAAWFLLCANTTELQPALYEFRIFYPHSWRLIIALCFVGLALLTWSFLIGEMWSGLSGKNSWYFGSIGFQVSAPLLIMVGCAIWSNEIDAFAKRHPDFLKIHFIQITGWVLAVLIMMKMWLAARSWSKVEPRQSRRYVIVWAAGTLCLVGFAMLARPPLDVERQFHVYLLLALLLFPFARVGLAPLSLNKNRAR